MYIVMTAPVVDYKIHWLKMMSVPESRAIVSSPLIKWLFPALIPR